MIDKYCRDGVYGAMDIGGRIAVGVSTILNETFPRTHGYAQRGDDLTEVVNKALVELEDLLRISGDGVEVRGGE